MIKKTISFLSAATLLINTVAFAGVLGDVSGGYTDSIGQGSFFYKTEFDGGSRGRQTEHYIEYTPNEDLTPVLVDGDHVWGTLDIYEAQNSVTNQGYRSRGAINADYFSFKTGIPMGYTISDGEILTKENDIQPAVGFRKDGTAFIDDLQIETTLKKGEASTNVMFINKWCQPGFDPIYLLTDKFGDTTKTSSNCLYVICSVKSGKISIAEDAVLNVDEVFEYNGEIKIPDGKIVLLIDTQGGNAECMTFMRSLQVGDEVTVSNKAINSKKNLWHEATEASSTVGGRLLENGVIGSGFEAGVHPRTAVGIKADGKVIFYTLDGRSTGYSTGATLTELAQRLQELGCMDAINFDGGGSTTIGAWLSTQSAFQVLNRPSDGYIRNVANYIFLRDNRLPTGIPKTIKYKTILKNIYTGASQTLEIETVYDTSDYEMTDYTAKISSSDAEVDANTITFNKTGEIAVNVKVNDVNDTVIFNVYDKVDSLKIYNTSNWQEITSINLSKGEKYEATLRGVPYADENELVIAGDSVKWEIDSSLGTISDEGILKINTDSAKSGVIKASIGGIAKEISVNISSLSFYDISGHWAKDMVYSLVEDGIFSGIQNENGLGFFPDNNMTRAEFAMMMCRYLGLDMENTQQELNFTDADKIQPWAVNAIKAAVKAGIMNGRSDDNGKTYYFAPEDTISRAEAMTVIGRTIDDESEYSFNFTDKNDIPQWSAKEIYKLAGKGIVNGYSDNTIKPLNKVTRAEAASLIYKMIKS